jgi:hypothetical protein
MISDRSTPTNAGKVKAEVEWGYEDMSRREVEAEVKRGTSRNLYFQSEP